MRNLGEFNDDVEFSENYLGDDYLESDDDYRE